MLVPTRRMVVLAGLAAGIAGVAGLVPALMPAAWTLDGLLLLSGAADLALALGHRLRIERKTPQIWSLGRRNRIELTIQNRSGRRLRGTVMDDPTADTESFDLPLSLDLPARGEVKLGYEVVPRRRGRRELGAVTVRYGAPLGLVMRQEKVDLPEHVDVYPDVHAARELAMLRRQGRKDARVGSLRVRGGDTEFERLRPYSVGDEMRHVDWRATARRDDLIVRQFQAESDQNIVFAIDIGRSMREKSGALDAVDWALNAALLCADVAIRGGDKAGLLTFDELPRAFVKPQGGRRGATRLVSSVFDLESTLHATDYRAAMAYLKTKLRARSLLVILTRVLEPQTAKELASAVRVLLPTHLPLCVFLREPALGALATGDGSAGRDEDAFAMAAAAEALTFREGLLRRIRREGALVLDARPEDVTMALVSRYLEVKARRLL